MMAQNLCRPVNGFGAGSRRVIACSESDTGCTVMIQWGWFGIIGKVTDKRQNRYIARSIIIVMLNSLLANFYERDIRKLIEEVNLFKNEEDLWRTQGSVKNSSGNLVLHIIGGLNHFFGATLAHTGYVRDRAREFSDKGVKRKDLVAQLEALIPMMNTTLNELTPEQMEGEFPIFFDEAGTSASYVLVRLLAHLSYHLGQVNYLRRIFE
jgi:hypothetical protein